LRGGSVCLDSCCGDDSGLASASNHQAVWLAGVVQERGCDVELLQATSGAFRVNLVL